MKHRCSFLFFALAVVALYGGCGKSNPADEGTDAITFAGMKLISGGTFQMGSANGYSDELPVHRVTVSSFHMDTTEVTQADYTTLMGVNPSHFAGNPLLPVEQVTWYDAVLYCNARTKRDSLDTVYTFTSITGLPGYLCSGLAGLAVDTGRNGYRLPTEAEWEYACRAGDSAAYYWGGSYPLATAADTAAMDSNAVWWHNSPGISQQVATKKPNAFGLYDMSGNVWEWCNDLYGSYSSGAQTDPAGPSSGSNPVMRGGSWSGDDDFLRSTFRDYGDFSGSYRDVGFRCVRR